VAQHRLEVVFGEDKARELREAFITLSSTDFASAFTARLPPPEKLAQKS